LESIISLAPEPLAQHSASEAVEELATKSPALKIPALPVGAFKLSRDYTFDEEGFED
jgi:hypothetical protein